MHHSLNDTLLTVVATFVIINDVDICICVWWSIETRSVKHINYMVLGILFIYIAIDAVYTSTRINNDITSGITNRLHSISIARSSIYGHRGYNPL